MTIPRHSFLFEKVMQKSYAEGIHVTGNFDSTQNLKFGRIVFEKVKKFQKENENNLKFSTFSKAKTFEVKKLWA